MRIAVLALGLLVAAAHGSGYQRIPAGEYRSVLKYEDLKGNRAVARCHCTRSQVPTCLTGKHQQPSELTFHPSSR